ncbi:MAG: outer membrane lipoprotein carrier protein LolA [Candidatus Methylumidiphilus sp.]
MKFYPHPRPPGAIFQAATAICKRLGNQAQAVFRVALWSLLLAGISAPAMADFDVDALLRVLARQPTGRAAFTEKKFLPLLYRPLESSGELVYLAPGHLEKNTLKPRLESLILDRDGLTLKREGLAQPLRPPDHPDAAAFIDSLGGAWAGDRAGLERRWRLSVQGSAAAWTLVLLPTAADRAAVSRIDIAGEAGQVRSVALWQANGARSLLALAPFAAKP